MKSVAIIGGGPAAMALGCFLDTSKYAVTIYEKNKALGRKFLVAGKGGFNLTHGMPVDLLIQQYTPRGFLDQALRNFTNEDFRAWLLKIGIPTFEGSSNRIFPEKGIKPIEVLRAILTRLEQNKVRIEYGVEWKNNIEADIVVYALGGASWSVTGSDGKWTKYFDNIIPFKSANCAFEVKWDKDLLSFIEGKPLKNISIQCNNIEIKGEVVLTKFGIEGNAIYAHSQRIQEQLLIGNASIYIDLKTHLSQSEVLEKLKSSSEKNVANKLKRDIKLSKTAINLLRNKLTKEEWTQSDILAGFIKKLPIQIVSAAPIEEAISTTGGIHVKDLDEHFQLRAKPSHYCVGEMVDWNAPTGGFLLQACFSMGHFLATNLNASHL
ncbi:BaiN/RdsA family NAD(P)/FAD-dependent oxidoreductase [Portibacter lacus]|uniref:NAD(FAD)-utilizing dehydrogenase n=1 Tax=Portibacter lacus TaxID=1099794 RepID=A0AA37SND3_9BACT|nr:TIGR03862 family flavoprotein [Portibacter lacus]GLR16239.1 NAD(FAD)-utilizing dehydrogenase [Portibacter lacus]